MQREILDNAMVTLVLVIMLLMGSCLLERVALAEQDEAPTPVQARPVEADFQMLVSICVDQAIWQDNPPMGVGKQDLPESTMGTYVARLIMCLQDFKNFTPHSPEGELK